MPLRRLDTQMDTDNLYKALSARITAAVVDCEADDWPVYFSWLRDVVSRVVAETTESGLSAAEKDALIQRLLEHVSALENWWPKLKARSRTSK